MKLKLRLIKRGNSSYAFAVPKAFIDKGILEPEREYEIDFGANVYPGNNITQLSLPVLA